MKKGTKERYKNYARRFLDKDVLFRQKWVSFWRYLGMLIGLIGEKIRGVDYALIYQEENGRPHCGDYTMSPTKVIKRIVKDLNNVSELGFIDVGCGKGYAIKLAYEKGFKVVGGVEYNKILYDICVSNMYVEKISTEFIKNDMAQSYSDYDKFDVFYFNNPFDEVILFDVLKAICAANEYKTCRCYYLNPSDKQDKAFKEAGFQYEKKIEDPDEKYFDINVYIKK